MYTYLVVLVLSLAVPVARSFEKKHIHFAGYFPYLFPAMFLTAAVFVPWDVLFTHWGVWGFNDEHLIGWYLFGLPIEEWLFFLVIPYVCLFSYEVLNYFIKKDVLGRYSGGITWLLILLHCTMLIIYPDHTYTSWVTVFNVVLLALIGIAWKPYWMSRFYLMYAVIVVPFLLVNGVLTGSFFDNVVVWYNPLDIMNIRVLTIPVEDLSYALGMLLMNTALYEFFRAKTAKSPWLEPRRDDAA